MIINYTQFKRLKNFGSMYYGDELFIFKKFLILTTTVYIYNKT
jgi:hypothetical protein